MNCSCIEGVSYRKYSESYDSYYCGICKEWLEQECDDVECYFCMTRPKQAPEEKEWDE
jgi:hypothetical protein